MIAYVTERIDILCSPKEVKNTYQDSCKRWQEYLEQPSLFHHHVQMSTQPQVAKTLTAHKSVQDKTYEQIYGIGIKLLYKIKPSNVPQLHDDQ